MFSEVLKPEQASSSQKKWQHEDICPINNQVLFSCVQFTYLPRKANGNDRQTKMKLSQSLCHVIVTYKVSNKGTSSVHHDFTTLQLRKRGEIPKLETCFHLTPIPAKLSLKQDDSRRKR